MDNNMMSLNIDKSMLTPIIEQQVKLLMTEVLGGKDEIVSKVINSVLKTKVDERGNPSTYSSAKPFYEWLLIDEIKKAVQELLKEEIQSRVGSIKKILKKHLQSEKGSNELANAMLTAFSSTISSGYGWKSQIEIKLEHESKDY